VQCFGVCSGFFILQTLPPWENKAFSGVIYLILAWFHEALEHEKRTLVGIVLGRAQALSLNFSQILAGKQSQGSSSWPGVGRIRLWESHILQGTFLCHPS